MYGDQCKEIVPGYVRGFKGLFNDLFHFLLLAKMICSATPVARNVPSSEERGEMGVFAGYPTCSTYNVKVLKICSQ